MGAPTEQLRDISLSAQMLEYGVTHLQCTPSLMHMILMEPLAATALHGLSHLLLGGEELPLALVKQLQSLSVEAGQAGRDDTTLPFQLHNMYGPTETTIWSTASVLESDVQEVSLGRPIANTQVYLLDTHLQPVPIGVAGEIYLGGEGLARGYLNQPGLTAERFLPNPYHLSCFCTRGRLYRTGDVARYRCDGTLAYLDRRDQQVKLRGYRIELGEIAASLRTHPAVQEAVVILRKQREDRHSVAPLAGTSHSPSTSLQKQLIAYVVTEGEERPTRDELHSHLRRQLPEYMIPANIVLLDRLPLTPNGKIDRQALPAPDQHQLHQSTEMVLPQTALQEQLAGIWTELLHLPQISIHSNFFELGGHSLLAAQLMLRIQTAFAVKVPLRSLFEAPTIVEMAVIIERMQNEIGAQESSTPSVITPQKRESSAIPLSFAQERLWFLDRLLPDSSRYVVSQSFHLSGPLHMKALERSLMAVIQRHEILRTTFSVQEELPVQVIAPDLVLQVPVIDLHGLLAAERDQQVKRLAQQDARRSFDLAHGPLLRIHMLRLVARQEHVFLFTLHHIIADGKWSMGILLRQLSAQYQAEMNGAPLSLPALPLQYADYAIWQRQELQGEVLEGLFTYWQRQLSGAPALLELPTDRPRPAEQSDAGSQQSLLLSPALLQELKRMSQREGVTLFMTLLAAFQVLLMRYSGQQDVAVGTPIAGRGQAGLENLIGFFVNTLVLRSDLSGNPSFRQLLTRVREVALQAYAHQDLPFEKLVESLQVERSLSHGPLFQVFFALQNVPAPDVKLPDIAVRQLEKEHFTALFDLSLELTESERGLLIEVEYSTDLFDAATIERLLGHWQVLLEAIVRNPEQQIEMLPLLTPREREQLLVQWNATAKDMSPDLCLHQLIEQQVERMSEGIAVVFEEAALTYRELNDRANQLACVLQRTGAGPDVLVGVCLERSLELVVGLLAILKAGAAYVPLDPSYPKTRLAWMLTDTQPVVVLTQTHLMTVLPVGHAQVICLDTDWERIVGEPTLDLESKVSPDNLAYMIYTSGSTGKPKGSMNTQ
ncbi:MAG: non-ribosomal peptide synthetase, partial [Chloroflexi bacterium]